MFKMDVMRIQFRIVDNNFVIWQSNSEFMKFILRLICFATLFTFFGCRITNNKSTLPIDDMNPNLYMFVGTYTSPNGSQGIYLYNFNQENGTHDFINVTPMSNPSYLTISDDEKYVYVVSERGLDDSFVQSFSFDKKIKMLRPINRQETKGSSCYVAQDAKTNKLYVANYGGGSVAGFDVDKNGNISPIKDFIKFEGTGADPKRQKSSHVHTTVVSPDRKYLLVTDLDLDKMYRFNLNAKSLSKDDITENAFPSKTGPRHIDFSKDGKRLYVLGEISGEIHVFDFSDNAVKRIQTIAADWAGGQGSADIHISHDGKFLYASNRLKEDGIAIFKIDAADGKLSKIGYQLTAKHPRNFGITPNGKFLLVAGRDDNKIQVFKRDFATGLLTDTHQDIQISKPVCIQFTTND